MSSESAALNLGEALRAQGQTVGAMFDSLPVIKFALPSDFGVAAQSVIASQVRVLSQDAGFPLIADSIGRTLADVVADWPDLSASMSAPLGQMISSLDWVAGSAMPQISGTLQDSFGPGLKAMLESVTASFDFESTASSLASIAEGFSSNATLAAALPRYLPAVVSTLQGAVDAASAATTEAEDAPPSGTEEPADERAKRLLLLRQPAIEYAALFALVDIVLSRGVNTKAAATHGIALTLLVALLLWDTLQRRRSN